MVPATVLQSIDEALLDELGSSCPLFTRQTDLDLYLETLLNHVKPVDVSSKHPILTSANKGFATNAWTLPS